MSKPSDSTMQPRSSHRSLSFGSCKEVRGIIYSIVRPLMYYLNVYIIAEGSPYAENCG